MRQLVAETFGVADFGGFATEGHIPGSDHHRGRAVDVMLTPLGPASTALGWQIAAYLQSRAQELGITYLIWNAHIWSPERAGEGWRPYAHPAGDRVPRAFNEVAGPRGRLNLSDSPSTSGARS